jgi:hypothetical protein
VPSQFARYLAPLVCWLISIGLVLLMVNFGRRRAVLTVSEDRLGVEESRPFCRTRRGGWERAQLFAICAGPTRGDFRKLEIYPRGEPLFTLLYTGPAMELEWLAGVLRQGLRLGATPTLPREIREGVTSGPLPAVSPPDSDRRGDWFGAAFVGMVCVTILWNVFNARGFLDHLGLPWSNVFLCAAGGAAIGIGCAALYRADRQHQVRRLVELGRSMNLAFQPVASREALGDFFYLRLFRHWLSASNRMTGIIDGVPVDMLDCTFASHHRQTVLLLPAPERGLMPFDLRPRDYCEKAFGVGLADETGTTVKPCNGQPRRVRECIERFRLRYDLRRYYLSEHFEDAADWAALTSGVRSLRLMIAGEETTAWAALKGRGHADSGLGPDRAGTEEDIRQFFNLDLLDFFARHPGWRIESDGPHLALWRPYRTIRAARRPRFVAEALEVYRALARAAAMMAPGPSQAVQETGIGQSMPGQFEKGGAWAWRRLQP